MSNYAVLGLDLSITATGIARWDDEPYTLRFGTGKSAPKGDRRLTHIRNEIVFALDNIMDEEGDGEYDLAVIEGLPGYGAGSKALGLVHGVAREALAAYDVPVIYISPSSLKKFATNNGKAEKKDMKAEFERIAPFDLTAGSFDDNAIDAWLLQQVGLLYLGDKIPTTKGLKAGYDVLKQVKEKD